MKKKNFAWTLDFIEKHLNELSLIKLTDQEKIVAIEEPNLIIKGRSGTGKTTSLVIKILIMYMVSKNK